MNSKTYWRKREEANKIKNEKDEIQYAKEIKKVYDNMYVDIDNQINAFYARYATKEGISLAEAKKRVEKLEIAVYERKAKEYVRKKSKTDKANAEMRIYNLTMKVNRLELLKANIGLTLNEGFDNVEAQFNNRLIGRTQSEFERQAGILGESVFHNNKMIKNIVGASFYNASFSDRIWQHQDILKANLDIQLQRGLIQGKNPRVLARDIRDRMNVSFKDACRLMQTELARVQMDAQMMSYKEFGYEYYKFMASAGCCPVCEAINGKIFKVDEAMAGENAQPMHPYCRCSTAASMGENGLEDYEKWIEARGKGEFEGSFKEWQTADKEADKLIKKALEKDKTVTALLNKAVMMGTGKLEGLDYRIKGQGSLRRKLYSKANKKNLAIEEYAKKVTDVLRYTNVSDVNNLTSDYFKVVEYLKDNGYNLVESTNTFPIDGDYKGINTLIKDSRGYIFELQFHTYQSLEIKEINHKLYEEQRKLGVSEKEIARLGFEMKMNAEKVKTPRGIERVKDV